MEEEKKNISSVYFSFEVCAAPLKKNKKIIPETETEGSEGGVGTNNVNGEQKKEGLQSLIKAAVAIFPLPTTIQPNVCQVKDILLFHGVLLAKSASLCFQSLI